MNSDKTGPRSGWRGVIALVVCLSAMTAMAQDEDLNPIDMQLIRQHPAVYRAGAPLEIIITISAYNAENLTAVGLYETMPPGWEFLGMRGITGQPPAVAPAEGETGVLQFAWIHTPELPFTFAYTVLPPADDSGMKVISGQIEYREFGSAQYSTPVITQIGGPDGRPPVVTLLGDNPMTIDQGTPYIEPGFTAQDDVDGDVSNLVRIIGVVDVNQPGQYVLTYIAGDRAGNQSEPVQRVVRVVQAGSGSGADGRIPPNSGYFGGGGYLDPEAQSQLIAARRQRAVGAPMQPSQVSRAQSAQGSSAAEKAFSDAQANRGVSAAADARASSSDIAAPDRFMPDTGETRNRRLTPRQGPVNADAPSLSKASSTANEKPPTPSSGVAEQQEGSITPSPQEMPGAMPEMPSERPTDNLAAAVIAETAPSSLPPSPMPAPGMWDAIALTLRSMGPTQWAIFGMVLVIVAALIVLTTIAGKTAYTGPTRRSNGRTRPIPGENPPAGA